MAYCAIGIELELNLKMKGVEHPSGKLSLIISTLERISLITSSRLVPHSNSMKTMEILSFDEEVISFRPSMEFNWFSINLLTLVSISLALAPA